VEAGVDQGRPQGPFLACVQEELAVLNCQKCLVDGGSHSAASGASCGCADDCTPIDCTCPNGQPAGIEPYCTAGHCEGMTDTCARATTQAFCTTLPGDGGAD
jgi:hypothetical protein